MSTPCADTKHSLQRGEWQVRNHSGVICHLKEETNYRGIKGEAKDRLVHRAKLTFIRDAYAAQLSPIEHAEFASASAALASINQLLLIQQGGLQS